MGIFAVLVSFILLLALPDVQSSDNPTGFSIRLIHKYSPESPFYPGNLTFSETMKRMGIDSEARVSYLNSINDERGRLITPFVTNIGFSYVVEVRVGDPGEYFYFLLDTGADMSWVLCKEDRGWFPGKEFYNPYISKFHKEVHCEEPVCNGYCQQGKCVYKVSYLDKDKVEGTFIKDVFRFKAPEEMNIQNVLFVCADPEKTQLKMNDIKGLLAINRDPKSFTSQSFVYAGGRFSYCLVPPTENGLTPMSYLKFGDDVGQKGPRVQTTKFLKLRNPLYYLDLVDISVNGKRLHYPPGAFRKIRNSGFVIDSGSSFTFLKRDVYWKLHNAIEEHLDPLQLVKREPCLFGIHGVNGIQLCYVFPKVLTTASIPSMTYHFSDGANLRIAPEQTFVINRKEERIDFAVALDARDNVLGAYQQHNTRFTYDNRLDTLSFVAEDCSRDPS